MAIRAGPPITTTPRGFDVALLAAEIVGEPPAAFGRSADVAEAAWYDPVDRPRLPAVHERLLGAAGLMRKPP